MLLLEMFVQVLDPFEAFLAQMTSVWSLLGMSALMAHKLVLIGAHLSTNSTCQVFDARPAFTSRSAITFRWTWHVISTKQLIGAHYVVCSSIRARVVQAGGEGDRLRRPL